MAKERFTVLTVEDQPMNREILRNIVETEYDVLEAENGRDALALLARRKNVSAILLDIVMPVMDGYTFLRRLKETPFADTPVIVMTGEKDEMAEQTALEMGAWDFVSKTVPARHSFDAPEKRHCPQPVLFDAADEARIRTRRADRSVQPEHLFHRNAASD